MTGIVIARREIQEIFRNIFDASSIQADWQEALPFGPLSAAPDFVLDLDFGTMESSAAFDRIKDLSRLQVPVIFINSVATTLKALGADRRIVRINGWNTFLQRPLAEIVAHPSMLGVVEGFCRAWGRPMEALPDVSGMPSARIVSGIINEAYFALGEQVSTRENVDTAMRLGTNYPYGPFEWCEKIGILPIYFLLVALSQEQPRYTIAPLLREEALAHGTFA